MPTCIAMREGKNAGRGDYNQNRLSETKDFQWKRKKSCMDIKISLILYRYLIIIKVNIQRKFIQYFSNDIEERTFTGILTTYIQKNNFKLWKLFRVWH